MPSSATTSRLPPQAAASVPVAHAEEGEVDQPSIDRISTASIQPLRPDDVTYATEEGVPVSEDLTGDSQSKTPTSDDLASTVLQGPVAVDSDVPVEMELWPVAAGEAFAGLPKGWERRRDVGGRLYYIDHKRGITTWQRPPGATATPRTLASPGEMSTAQCAVTSQQYSLAQKSYLVQLQGKFKIDLERRKRNTKCRIVSESSPWHDLNLSETALFLEHLLQNGEDVVCIIEDISVPWIAHLGVSYDIPKEFLASHFSDRTIPSPMHRMAKEMFSSIEDSMERLLRIAQAMDAEEAERTLLPPLDRLSESLAYARSTVGAWDSTSTVSNMDEVEASCRADIQTLSRVRTSLREFSVHPRSDNIEFLLGVIEKIEAALDTFKIRRHSSWYCQWIDVKDDNLGNRVVDDAGKDIGRWIEGRLSYIRLKKSLVLVLVDHPIYYSLNDLSGTYRPMPLGGLPSGARTAQYHCRVRPDLHLPNRPLLPLEPGRVYEALAGFAFQDDYWRLNVLCAEGDGETVSPSESHATRNPPIATQDDEHRYAALDPQAFVYLFAGFLWETRLQDLGRTTRAISFSDSQDLDPRDAIRMNNALTDYRQQLDFLMRQVTYDKTHAPAYLDAFYNTFPIIRWRHQAKNRSPLDQLSNILSDAKDLQRLLIDSFQMLMSSVTVQQAAISVQQATLSNEQASIAAKQASASTEQARAATRITALAFVYIPLTFVTGIFGMNIRTGAEAPNGFIWYAPLVTLAVAIVFTAALWFAADWIEVRLAEKREKRKPDTEKGQSPKTKSE